MALDAFGYPVLVLWFYCTQTLLKYLPFQSYDFERTWLITLFQRRVLRFKLDIYVFILKPVALSRPSTLTILSILSVPGYSSNASSALHLIAMFFI